MPENPRAEGDLTRDPRVELHFTAVRTSAGAPQPGAPYDSPALGAPQPGAPYLFGADPADPAVFGGVTLILALAVVLATAVPERRAGRVEPATVLKAD